MSRIRLAFLLMLPAAALMAQLDPAKPEFEVASIRPSAAFVAGIPRGLSVKGGPGTTDPERVTIENYTLTGLIMDAWDIKLYQLSGPDWLMNNFGPLALKFDISAKVPAGATKAQYHLMMQKLLTDRFKLALHHETRELPVYNLIVVKSGPKVKPSPKDPPPPSDSARGDSGFKLGSDGFPILPPGYTMMAVGGRGRMRNPNLTMEKFAVQLSNQSGRTVFDKTGLAGEYDIGMSWQADGAPVAADGIAGPTLEQAVQDQLGLKLESAKGPVDILLIDHVEKTPTEN